MSISRREFLKLTGGSATAAAMLAQLGYLPPVMAQDVTTISFGGWGGVAAVLPHDTGGDRRCRGLQKGG